MNVVTPAMMSVPYLPVFHDEKVFGTNRFITTAINSETPRPIKICRACRQKRCCIFVRGKLAGGNLNVDPLKSQELSQYAVLASQASGDTTPLNQILLLGVLSIEL
jgi:hypothetical protein